jgi:hypothetical protein
MIHKNTNVLYNYSIRYILYLIRTNIHMESLHESIRKVINESDSLWLSGMQNQEGPRQRTSRTDPHVLPRYIDPYQSGQYRNNNNPNMSGSARGYRQPEAYGRYQPRKPAYAPPAMGRASPAEQMMNRSLNDTSYGRLPPQLRGRVGRRANQPYSYDNLNSSPMYGYRGIADPNTNSNSQYGQNYANWLNRGMGSGDDIARFLNNQ